MNWPIGHCPTAAVLCLSDSSMTSAPSIIRSGCAKLLAREHVYARARVPSLQSLRFGEQRLLGAVVSIEAVADA